MKRTLIITRALVAIAGIVTAASGILIVGWMFNLLF